MSRLATAHHRIDALAIRLTTMRPLALIIATLGLAAAAGPAHPCGLRDAHLQRGTPIQELTIPRGAQLTMGFGGASSTVIRSGIVAQPCHGTLIQYQTLDFRYVPAPNFVGIDTYAIQGCIGPGRCEVTSAVITVRP